MTSLCKNALLASGVALFAALAAGVITIPLMIGALTGIWVLVVFEHYGLNRDDER